MFKYNEDDTLSQVLEYIKGTYTSHYVGSETNGIQTNDLLISTGRAEDFYIGSILKYAARYGKKNGKNKMDLFKIMHYVCLLVDLNHTREEEKERINKELLACESNHSNKIQEIQEEIQKARLFMIDAARNKKSDSF
jgi:hypothetical protein